MAGASDMAPAAVQALLFDLDGTLIDSMPLHELTWKQWHAVNGLPYDEAGFFAATAGRSGQEILADLFPGKTRAELDKQQREYFLQQQMKAIKEELGGDNVAEVKDMLKKAETKKWTDAARDMFKKGIEKLERMHPSTPDYSVVYNHLDLMLDLPWLDYTEDRKSVV